MDSNSQRTSSNMPPPQVPPQTGGSVSSHRSSGSGKKKSRDKDPASQLSTIEKSVTHLLIATKQLLETLTQWSRKLASENDVSDVYVRLGYEFNIACRAFTTIGVPTDDLGPVPDLLRGILEETLSQDADPASLDKFLPRIRDIIINLLHGLKKKQSKLRAAKQKEPPFPPNGQGPRQTSIQGAPGDEPGPSRQRTPSQRDASGGDGGVPPRGMSGTQDQGSAREGGRSRDQPPQLEELSLSTITADNLMEEPQEEEQTPPVKRISLSDNGAIPPPPPPPKQQDAMAMLQRGGELERRASRRYSQFLINKHLGGASVGVPMIPPAQNSPLPNRGRDVRESLNAVRARGPDLPAHQRQRSIRTNHSSSPSRGTPASRKISEETPGSGKSSYQTPHETRDEESPLARSQVDKLGPAFQSDDSEDQPALSGTVSGPPLDSLSQFPMPTPTRQPEPQKSPERSLSRKDAAPIGFVPEESPQPGTELTLFLDYKRKVKKIVLPDGANDLSLARLQLAFIEAFNWNTSHMGVDLPEIYIQDQVSGVRYELEDLADVKDRTVLVLNVEALDEVKKHMDEGFDGLYKVIDGIKHAVDGQQAALTRVMENQTETTKEIARASVVPPAAQAPHVNGIRNFSPSTNSEYELASLRRELLSVRQTFKGFTDDVASKMTAVREKAQTVKAKSIDTAIPDLDEDTGRAYVNKGRDELGDNTEGIVNRVDSLQDTIEDLRKDVVTRGVRPLPRQLEIINKDIVDLVKELKKTQEYVKKVKPVWPKVWEKELDRVCQDRDFFSQQQELVIALEEDLEEAASTMSLVEEATKQQSLEAPVPGQASLRSTSRGMPNINPSIDPTVARDGVLGEVRALQPNHENRLEAIERAERNRARELVERQENAAFRKELRTFVDGGRLKTTGIGVDEIDRMIQQRAEEALRQEHQDVQTVKAERAKARAEKRAREAAEAAAVEQGDGAGDGVGDAADVGEDTVNEQARQDSGEAVESPTVAENEVKRGSWLPAIFSS